MNHCVQVVGYAFAEAGNGEDKHSGDNHSGDEHNSGDSHDREDRNLGSGSRDNDVSYDGTLADPLCSRFDIELYSLVFGFVFQTKQATGL